MIKVRGLPVDITESDIQELFKNYGKIQSVIIKRERDEIVVYVELDQNEELAIEELDRTEWRGYILYLDPVRGQDDHPVKPGGDEPVNATGDEPDQPPGRHR